MHKKLGKQFKGFIAVIYVKKLEKFGTNYPQDEIVVLENMSWTDTCYSLNSHSRKIDSLSGHI